ncbi:MAG: hypothetical protein ABW250_08180 [Pyrinomonadaceae bacterium]
MRLRAALCALALLLELTAPASAAATNSAHAKTVAEMKRLLKQVP